MLVEAILRASSLGKVSKENLGHHTAAFTLDVYGHVTEKIKQDSAARMKQFIKGVIKPQADVDTLRDIHDWKQTEQDAPAPTPAYLLEQYENTPGIGPANQNPDSGYTIHK